jgi:hypothetical protein
MGSRVGTGDTPGGPFSGSGSGSGSFGSGSFGGLLADEDGSGAGGRLLSSGSVSPGPGKSGPGKRSNGFAGVLIWLSPPVSRLSLKTAASDFTFLRSASVRLDIATSLSASRISYSSAIKSAVSSMPTCGPDLHCVRNFAWHRFTIAMMLFASRTLLLPLSTIQLQHECRQNDYALIVVWATLIGLLIVTLWPMVPLV